MESKKLLPAEDKKSPGKRKPRSDNAADILIKILNERFELMRDQNGEAFAVDKQANGNIAVPVESLRPVLAEIFYKQQGKAAYSNALGSVILLAQNKASHERHRQIPLRVGRNNTGIWIDIGDESGQVIWIRRGRWSIEDRSPQPFRRTEATRPIPVDADVRGDISSLRELFNLNDSQWEFLVNWMAIAWVPDIPHAVLVTLGGPGRAKTSLCEMVLNIIDPSAGALAGLSRDKDLRTHASGSLVIGLENVTHVSPDQSDLLSQLVTGQESRERRYYTNGELKMVSLGFRVILMNGIAITGIRPDLQDRCINIHPAFISPEERRTTSDIDGQYQKARTPAVSFLLDLLAKAYDREERGFDTLTDMPRMASFAQWLAHMDGVRHTHTLDGFVNTVQRDAVETSLESSVGAALEAYLRDSRSHPESDHGNGVGKHKHSAAAPARVGHAHRADGSIAYWRHNPSTWLSLLTAPQNIDTRRDWPRSAKGFANAMRMIENGLVVGGWHIQEVPWGRQSHWEVGLPEDAPEAE